MQAGRIEFLNHAPTSFAPFESQPSARFIVWRERVENDGLGEFMVIVGYRRLPQVTTVIRLRLLAIRPERVPRRGEGCEGGNSDFRFEI